MAMVWPTCHGLYVAVMGYVIVQALVDHRLEVVSRVRAKTTGTVLKRTEHLFQE